MDPGCGHWRRGAGGCGRCQLGRYGGAPPARVCLTVCGLGPGERRREANLKQTTPVCYAPRASAAPRRRPGPPPGWSLAKARAAGPVSLEVIEARREVCVGADRCHYAFRAKDGRDYCRSRCCGEWRETPLEVLTRLRARGCSRWEPPVQCAGSALALAGSRRCP